MLGGGEGDTFRNITVEMFDQKRKVILGPKGKGRTQISW